MSNSQNKQADRDPASSSTSSAPPFDPQLLKRMMMSQDMTVLDSFGKQAGLLKLFGNVDPELGIDSTSIGDRIRKFGDGNIRLEEKEVFIAIREKRERKLAKQARHANSSDRRRHDESDNHSDYLSNFVIDVVDRSQNHTEFEVIRDGGEVKNVLGCEIVVGDIIKLKAYDIEKFRKQEEEEEKQRRKEKNKNDDNDDDDDEKEAESGMSRWRMQQRLHRRCIVIPADCLVLEGSVQMDASELTGESDCPVCTPNRNPFLVGGAKIVEGACLALVCVVGEPSNLGEILQIFIDVRLGESESGCRCC